MEPSILHADLDSFYASVEQRDDPALRGRPVLVGGGVVLAASYEAKARGVSTPMNVRHALHRCPDAIVVPPRFEAYVEASRRVFEVFHDTTPVVEGISIDEAFLDVSGLRRLRGPAVHVAAELRRQVRERVGLPITVGVARTKFLAKVASGAGKPDGLLVVEPGDERRFLHALPVQKLWGVGPVTAEALNARGLRTVGQVAAIDEPDLVAMIGKAAGRHLHALANLRDPRPVITGQRRGSMGAQHALGRGPHGWDVVDGTMLALVDRVTGRMRAAGRTGATVTVRVRLDDFRRLSRARTLPTPTDRTETVLSTARDLLADLRPLLEREGVTLVGVSVGNLDDHGAQLELPLGDDENPRAAAGAALDDVLDAVRGKFGRAAVERAVQLGRHAPSEAPHLPD